MPKKAELQKKDVNELKKQINKLTKKLDKIEININNNKTKKLKDPNEPKKYKNAYMFFNMEKIEDYKKKYPKNKINVVDIAKESGKEWKKVKSDEKKYEKYKKLEENDKKRYKKEIENYKKK